MFLWSCYLTNETEMRNTQNKNQQRKTANECVIHSWKLNWTMNKCQIHLTYPEDKTRFIVQNLSCKSSIYAADIENCA